MSPSKRSSSLRRTRSARVLAKNPISGLEIAVRAVRRVCPDDQIILPAVAGEEDREGGEEGDVGGDAAGLGEREEGPGERGIEALLDPASSRGGAPPR